MLHVQNMSSTVQHNTNCPTEELMAVGVKIHAVDYKPLDIPEPRTAYYCCGRKRSGYVERLTAERKARANQNENINGVNRDLQ